MKKRLAAIPSPNNRDNNNNNNKPSAVFSALGLLSDFRNGDYGLPTEPVQERITEKDLRSDAGSRYFSSVGA